MGKVRVYSLAQEMGVKSNLLLDLLKEMGKEVKGHMSAIDDDVVDTLRAKVKALGAGAREGSDSAADREVKPVEVKAERPAPKPAEVRNEKPVQAKPAEARNDRPQEARTANQGERKDRPRHPEGKREGRPADGQQRPPQDRKGPAQQGEFRREGRPQQQQGQGQQGQNQQGQGQFNGGRQNGKPNQQNRPHDGNRPQGENRPVNHERRDSKPGQGEGRRDGKPAFADKGGRPNDGKRDFRQGERRDSRPQAPAPAAAQPAAADRGDRRDGDSRRVTTKIESEKREARLERENRTDAKLNLNQNKGKNRPQANNTDAITQAEVAAEIMPKNETMQNVIEIELPMSVKGLAELLKANPNQLIGKLIGLGVMATINQNLDQDTIELLAAEFGKTVLFKTQEEKIKSRVIEDRSEDLLSRPPIVTIMGHVDHGKTSLLDVIRHTNVTATEAGGITQHIGAYQAMINGKRITFLDTPGHEAFTAMRARGAQLTDIAILVVAADDGVMPQTIEAINHAKAAGIQIIVAINKIDKESANSDRVLQELSEHGLIPESWGGETICVEVSALKKMNIDTLLEMILLVAEMGELKANPNRPADGVVVESELDKGRGPVATILVKRGTLHVGDSIVAGTAFGRVRAMISDKGERLDKATPSTPVVVLGLSDVPAAGDSFEVVDDDKTARSIAEERVQRRRAEEMSDNRAITLDDLFKQIKEGEIKDLNIIIKADVQGSIEALRDSLLRLSTEEVRVSCIHTGVGAVTESDVVLANASNAIIIGFNVRPDLNARKLAEQHSVDIRTYRVIYQAIEEVRAALEGLLDPEQKEVVTGRAEIRAVFKVPKVGAIAGTYVTDGKINRNSFIRLLRNGIVIHEGKIGSLKRFQDDVKEVAQGYECGIGIEGYNDLKEGDEFEVYVIEEIRRTLD